MKSLVLLTIPRGYLSPVVLRAPPCSATCSARLQSHHFTSSHYCLLFTEPFLPTGCGLEDGTPFTSTAAGRVCAVLVESLGLRWGQNILCWNLSLFNCEIDVTRLWLPLLVPQSHVRHLRGLERKAVSGRPGAGGVLAPPACTGVPANARVLHAGAVSLAAASPSLGSVATTEFIQRATSGPFEKRIPGSGCLPASSTPPALSTGRGSFLMVS